jgi:PAS domain S-box-containing protein
LHKQTPAPRSRAERPEQRSLRADSRVNVEVLPFRVAAAGGSAGGLEAFKTVMEELPTGSAIAFLLIQPPDPAGQSALAGFFSKVTSLPVVNVSGTTAVQTNHVYVIPPDKNVFIRNGILRLGPGRSLGPGRPVEDFKAVLAAERQNAALLDEELHQRERELEALFDSSPDAFLRFDSNFRVTHANAAFGKATGIPPQDMVGRTGSELPLPPRIVRRVDRVIKRVFETGQPERVEFTYPSPGGPTEQEVRYAPEFAADGSVIAVLAIGRDITVQKRMEQTLRQREQELATLFDNSPDVIVRLDPKLRALYINSTWERATGIAREAALGKTSQEIGIRQAVVQLQERAVRRVFETRRPVTVEFSDPSPAGPAVYEVRHIPEFALNGSVCSVLAIGRDITEQRRLEKLAAENARDIRALTARLMTAQEQERRRIAREIHDSLCQDLGILACELRDVAAGLPASSPARKALQAARDRALRAADGARHVSHQLHPAILDDLGLEKALQTLCEEFGHREGVDARFGVRRAARPVPQEVASCVYRVAQETLNNIAKHAHAKHVSVMLSGNRKIHLSIRDDGVGFDRAKIRGAGGLGLVSMEERARIAGGKLLVTAQPGRGTCVQLVIPLPRAAHKEDMGFAAGR